MKFEEKIKERLHQFEKDLDDLKNAPDYIRRERTEAIYKKFVNDLTNYFNQ